MAQGLVKKLLVVIKDATTDEALEHFVFSLLWVKPLAFFENEAAVKRSLVTSISVGRLMGCA